MIMMMMIMSINYYNYHDDVRVNLVNVMVIVQWWW